MEQGSTNKYPNCNHMQPEWTPRLRKNLVRFMVTLPAALVRLCLRCAWLSCPFRCRSDPLPPWPCRLAAQGSIPQSLPPRSHPAGAARQNGRRRPIARGRLRSRLEPSMRMESRPVSLLAFVSGLAAPQLLEHGPLPALPAATACRQRPEALGLASELPPEHGESAAARVLLRPRPKAAR